MIGHSDPRPPSGEFQRNEIEIYPTPVPTGMRHAGGRSSVSIKHVATGYVVTVDRHKSQLMNKSEAISLLRWAIDGIDSGMPKEWQQW